MAEEDEAPAQAGFPDDGYPKEMIEKDFGNVVPLFKNAISNIENMNAVEGPNRELLEELLNQKDLAPQDLTKFDKPETPFPFTQRESGIPLLNIGEFLFNTDPTKRKEATFWFRYALKFFEKNDPANIDRVLILLAVFCGSTKQVISPCFAGPINDLRSPSSLFEPKVFSAKPWNS